ncbi:hypothetical protein GCM10010271_67630 [Streptomyces kurssanovii]|nr:hypothetical protein GCM10010271_67630 [Streptomyces kurssanovii]
MVEYAVRSETTSTGSPDAAACEEAVAVTACASAGGFMAAPEAATAAALTGSTMLDSSVTETTTVMPRRLWPVTGHPRHNPTVPTPKSQDLQKFRE